MSIKYGFMHESDSEFPPIVIVNITNVCNLACIHCPHRVIKKRPGYRPQFMSEAVFERIAAEVSRNKIAVMRIACDGEGLLHPKFFKLMEIAKKHHVFPINLTTNGLAMDEAAARKIIESGIDVVDVSIDAFTEETYRSVRVGGDLKKVVQNVLHLVDLRNKQKSPLKIFVSFVKQPANISEQEAFQNFWEGKVDFVLLRNYCNMVGLVQDSDGGAQLPERYPCPQFWKRVTINYDGNIRYCVEDWENKTVVGNVMETTIKDVWAGKQYADLREKQLAGKYNEMLLCGSCVDWVASPWDFGYEKIINAKVRAGGKR